MWNDILYLFYYFENGRFDGIEVKFGEESFYYDEDYGENSWDYYCYPIKLGKNNGEEEHVNGDFPVRFDLTMSRALVNQYIKKFIVVRPEILEKVDKFKKENFKNSFVICVHYRGTDKFFAESDFISYEQFYRKILQVIHRELCVEKYKIFIATDEEPFIKYMIQKFGQSRICYNKNAIRSTNNKPFHSINLNNYQKGLDAMMDCLLLSEGNYLLRTRSNLSLWSTFFNPNIPVKIAN